MDFKADAQLRETWHSNNDSCFKQSVFKGKKMEIDEEYEIHKQELLELEQQYWRSYISKLSDGDQLTAKLIKFTDEF